MYVRTCPTCKGEFSTGKFQQVYCTKEHRPRNPARAAKRVSNNLAFVGVDGEGVDRPDGNHEYVMLSVGANTLWRDGAVLPLRDILSFLWEQYCGNPDACFVGFYLGYDFNMWWKMLPESTARLLLTNKGIAERKSQVKSRPNPFPDAVVWEGWELDIMAGRRFKLRPHVHTRSMFTDQCRNRTCRQELELANIGEPENIHAREMDWIVPESNGPWDLWRGTAKGFWEEAMSRLLWESGKDGSGKPVDKHGWMYVCDTGPFWQTSFLKVIDPKGWDDGGVCTPEEFETVVAGKADRGHSYSYGDSSYYESMQLYNVLENEILARVTTRLNEGFMNDKIPIKLSKSEWYGPGRAAQLWIDSLHKKVADKEAAAANRAMQSKRDRRNEYGLLNADVYMSMPSWFYDAAQASYYGGWFEQFMHGHVGDVWEYDVNSAYPHIISTLPCLHTDGLHTGTYEQGEDDRFPDDPKRYTLVYATVEGSDHFIGPLPHRTKQGLILRPLKTTGWYWLHEIQAAKRAGLVDTMDVERWVSYDPCSCPPPFNPDDIGITRMYDLRLALRKNSPAGKALKLVYNSAYGKTAQSIGQPKYSNPVYASLITAGCRTLILDAIASHPMGSAAISMVATDGVYFTRSHPSLPLSSNTLGLWDETPKVGMTQFMPGVYWDDDTRKRIADGESPKLKSRGISARDLAGAIGQLDYEFARSHRMVANGGLWEWPSLNLPVGFLMDTAKLALQRGKWETAGKVHHDSVRTISSSPHTKRTIDVYPDEGEGYIRSSPYPIGIDPVTTPYHKAFGYVDESDLIVSPDGDGFDYFRELINDD